MSVSPRTIEAANREPEDGTLGALLYADRARPRIAESEWSALVTAVALRQQPALNALYARAHRIVYTLALRITGSRDGAEEVTVDTFHEVWKRAGDYDASGGTVVGWIMNLARSRAIDRLRFAQRKKRTAPSGPDPLASAVALDAGAAVDRADQGRILRRALEVLNRAERAAIEMAFFSEMTYAETAAKLLEPLGTIKTRIRSGLLKLRLALGGERP